VGRADRDFEELFKKLPRFMHCFVLMGLGSRTPAQQVDHSQAHDGLVGLVNQFDSACDQATIGPGLRNARFQNLDAQAQFISRSAAIIAAAYWWKASRVAIRNTAASISDVPELYIQSTQVAFNESSRLYAYAAIWTGIAALLSAGAAVLGVL